MSKLKREKDTYTFGIFNGLDKDVTANLNLQQSVNMFFSDSKGLASRTIKPGMMEFMMQSQKIRGKKESESNIQFTWAYKD